MTESNTQTDRATGSCIVCGKKSELKCSGCINIFVHFCSTEHLKLMWPIHRLVCRENAHPFRLPPFSQEEADLTYARYTCAAESEEFKDYQVKIRGALGKTAGNDEAIQAALSALVGIRGSLLAPQNDLLDAPPAETIRRLRSANNLKVKGVPTPPTKQLALLFQLVSLLEAITANGNRPTDPESIWFSQLCHRLAASCAVTDSYFGSFETMLLRPSDPPDLVGFLTGGQLFPAVSKALMAFLSDPDDPRDKAFGEAALAATKMREMLASCEKIFAKHGL